MHVLKKVLELFYFVRATSTPKFVSIISELFSTRKTFKASSKDVAISQETSM